MKVDLSDAKAKLDRAAYHVGQLEAKIAEYLGSDFHKTTLDPKEGSLRFQSLHRMDKSINCLIGDAVGNIRSSLDYAAIAILKPITGKSDEGGFPFADDDQGFKGMVTKGYFSACPSLHVPFLDDVQAYKGGKGNTLWAINKLRNIDKHRLLIAAPAMAGVRVSVWDPVADFRMSNCWFGVRPGNNCHIIDKAPNLKFTDKPHPFFEIRIEEPGVVERAAVVKFLKEASEAAKAFLDLVEKA